VLDAIDLVLGLLRPGLLGLAVVLSGVAGIDWMVRTRRLNPFGRIARLFRTSVDPLLMPIERVVVRAGGLPTSAPWAAVVFVVVTGILLIAALGFAREQVALVLAALNSGPQGIYRLVVSWVFAILQISIVVRVIMSWIHLRPTAWYSRWAYRLSEPILRPLRNLIPMMGPEDVSPIAAYFLLGIVETLLLRLW
jgi:YggT family protein